MVETAAKKSEGEPGIEWRLYSVCRCLPLTGCREAVTLGGAPRGPSRLPGQFGGALSLVMPPSGIDRTGDCAAGCPG